MRDVPALWSGPSLVLVRCPRCGGPYRLLPGQHVFCWKCRRWLVLAEGERRPGVAMSPPPSLWEVVARVLAGLDGE